MTQVLHSCLPADCDSLADDSLFYRGMESPKSLRLQVQVFQSLTSTAVAKQYTVKSVYSDCLGDHQFGPCVEVLL